MNKAVFFLAITIFCCVGIITTASAQSRQMYSWTDENGVVHFTDQRPEGEDVTVHDIPDSEPQPAGEPEQMPEQQPGAGDETSLGQQRREELAQQRQEAQTEAELQEAECAARRALVERLEPHRRVFFVNEEGETERMDDVERANRVAVAKQYIEDNCN